MSYRVNFYGQELRFTDLQSLRDFFKEVYEGRKVVTSMGPRGHCYITVEFVGNWKIGVEVVG